jgi:hypothetical protein
MTLVRANGHRTTIAAKPDNFTTDAQLAVLPGGTAWALWQDGHRYFDQNCDITSVDDQSIQTARIPSSAKRVTPKPLRTAHLTEETAS